MASVDDWKLQIEAYGDVINGLVRFKIDLLNSVFNRYRMDISFGLITWSTEKRVQSEPESNIFFGKHIVYTPCRHINVRVDTYLYDYNMQFMVAMMIPDSSNCPDQIDNKKVIKNKWFGHSDRVNVNIPSLLQEPQKLKLKDWVKFRTPKLWQNKWIIGELTVINDETYKVLYRDKIEYEVKTDDIKPRLIHHYIDLSKRMEADKILLIGDRKDINICCDVMELYSILCNIFEDDYGYKCMWNQYRSWSLVDFVSMGKCVAFNVIDFLSINMNKGYKVKCIFDNNHYDDTMKLIADREYAVGNSLELKKPNESQGIIYFCDICLCRQGQYDFMFRCKLKKQYKYNGHDICLRCIYDMIQKYNQLHVLLMDVLNNDLTNDCIQSIVIYIAGNVVKL